MIPDIDKEAANMLRLTHTESTNQILTIKGPIEFLPANAFMVVQICPEGVYTLLGILRRTLPFFTALRRISPSYWKPAFSNARLESAL